MDELEEDRDEVEGYEEGEEEEHVLPHGRIRSLYPFERRLSRKEVAVCLDRGNPVRELRVLRLPPDSDLVAVGGNRRLDLRTCALERRGRRGGASRVALAVRPAAELVRLRAGRLGSLALREERAIRDLT